MLITAVVDKVGTFAMLRFCLQLFPEASKWATPVILVLALISIVYGALLAVGQRDIKRLVAYASISHFGFIIMGIFAMTSQGQSGATLYMVNHGISTAALMLVAGFLISRRGSRLIADYGGVQKVAPVLAGTFLIGGLATLSLPGLAPFVSEFLVLVGTFARHPVIGIIATFGIVLAALYTLVLYQRTMTGPVKPEVAEMPDLRVREVLVVAPLIVLLIFLGVYPKPVADIVNPAVKQTMSDVHQTDPKPGGGGQVSAAAVHSLWTTAADPISKIETPKIEYGQLSPTLIVIGGALIGVLIEAFVPRKSRYYAQAFLSAVTLAAAFAAVVALAAGGYGTTKAHIAAMGAIAVDGPSLFLQGRSCWPACSGCSPSPNGIWTRWRTATGSTPSPRRRPRCRERQREGRREGGVHHDGGVPVLLFAVSGMLVFPSANDLLTLFVALEVFSLPLYLLCALAAPQAARCRRRPRSSTSCSGPSPPRSPCSASHCSTGTRARCPTRRSRRSSTARSPMSTRHSRRTMGNDALLLIAPRWS